jgi:hypothetical protein
VINVIAIIGAIIVNVLASALPLNNLTTGQISDRFAVYFVPAGYVFAIWGVIYTGLIAFAIYQALPAQRTNPRLLRVGYLPAVTAVANAVWIFLWHYEQFPASLLAMLVLLASLILTYLRLDIGRAVVSRAERWCIDIPTSVYLGWITVATIANVTSLLSYLGWSGWGISPEIWAVIMLVIAAVLTLIVGLTRRDIAYMLVIIWATIGIAVKHAGTPLVAVTSWLVSAVVGLTVVYVVWRTGSGGQGKAQPQGAMPAPQ